MAPKVRLIVTGPPGPHNPKNVAYLKSLLELRENLSLKDQVIFLYEHGECERPLIVTDAVIADLYRLCDFLLFPSFREGFGIPILESGLVRMPIFAADIPSIRESAGDNAFLFDPNGDPDKVGETISETMLKDQVYQLRRKVINHYSWQAIVERRIIPLLSEVSKL
jgi:glycosyltransferase involved in cell wall biosynthesis